MSECKITWLRALLRPLVRFCIRHGLVLQDLVESSKELFIEAAVEELNNQDQKITLSRLSMISGLHRRDVSRIHVEGETSTTSMSMAQRIIGQWSHNKQNLNKNGAPRALDYSTEFKELVGLISTDVKPATVLFELERTGAAKRVAEKVLLSSSVYNISNNADEAFKHLGRDCNELISCVEENVFQGQETPNLHARTEYDNVYVKDLPEIRKWLLEEGSKFHKKARDFLAQHDKDINPVVNKEGSGQVVIGMFSITSE